jgi:hypothetical protein
MELVSEVVAEQEQRQREQIDYYNTLGKRCRRKGIKDMRIIVGSVDAGYTKVWGTSRKLHV